MARIGSSTLYGTLDLLVLETLRIEALHGLDILRGIEDAAGDSITIEEGALYPALHRLERDGLVAGEWGISAKKRRAKFYSLTGAGRAALQRETDQWVRHAQAVAKVLGLEWAPRSA